MPKHKRTLGAALALLSFLGGATVVVKGVPSRNVEASPSPIPTSELPAEIGRRLSFRALDSAPACDRSSSGGHGFQSIHGRVVFVTDDGVVFAADRSSSP